MTLPPAYLLVTHGSRDPRPQIAVERLAYLVRQQLLEETALVYSASRQRQQKDSKGGVGLTAAIGRAQSPLVGTAALEFASVPLHERIGQFARQARGAGLNRVQILPLFLLPGVHVRGDIPTEVALAQQALGEEVTLELRPHLGSHPGMTPLLAGQFSQLPAQGRILLAHGSRLRTGNQGVETIASQLEAVAAYWSVSPSLAGQVEALVAAGKRQIAIAPYFLFAGGIADAIAQQVQYLRQVFPQVKLLLGEPLGATVFLARLIVEGMER